MSLLQVQSPSSASPVARHAVGVIRQIADFCGQRVDFARRWMRRGLGFVQPQTLDPALLAQGLTLVLPGIESESVFTYGMCDGLHEGGVAGAIRVFNWGLPLPGGYLANLTGLSRNRRRARDVAEAIAAYQDAYPGRPVHVVAQSGGAGMAVFAVEVLPSGRRIDGLVLLNAALSPTYDLCAALERTRKGILNSYSNRDYVVLDWGTRLFGTMDRVFTTAAGCMGFREPDGLSAEGRAMYAEKLHQIAWRPEIGQSSAHWGGHLSSGTESYLARHIAPWIADATRPRLTEEDK